jgi:hypothetical protein
MASLANGGSRMLLGFHILNTEERGPRTDTRRGWAGRHGSAGLSPPQTDFGPSCATLRLLHFGSFSPSVVDFGRRYPCDQVEGSLGMNFWSFHLDH